MSWEHKGYKIEINDSGRFTAEVGDLTLAAESLAGMQREIEKASKPEILKKQKLALPVVLMIRPETFWSTQREVRAKTRIVEGVLTGINRTSGTLEIELGAATPQTKYRIDDVLPATEENRRRLERKLAAEAEHEDALADVKRHELGSSRRGHIEAGDYAKVIADIEEQHREKSQEKTAKEVTR